MAIVTAEILEHDDHPGGEGIKERGQQRRNFNLALKGGRGVILRSKLQQIVAAGSGIQEIRREQRVKAEIFGIRTKLIQRLAVVAALLRFCVAQ